MTWGPDGDVQPDACEQCGADAHSELCRQCERDARFSERETDDE